VTPIGALITAIGVLCTILGVLIGAAWRLASKQQKGNDILALLQDTMHKSTQVVNSLSRRVMALEFVIGQEYPDTYGIAQAAVKDEDSAVHWIGPTPKEGTDE
jgi:hypothetical protein